MFSIFRRTQPSFSIIMATYNRKNIIDDAIKSVLNQIYQNFELIIVDDGSTDNTEQHIKRKYAKELKSGKIRYFFLNHTGVCHARNYGLSVAKNDWIAYLDSDNVMLSDALAIFAKHTRFSKVLYANLQYMSNGKILGDAFDYDRLQKGNYIDLGTFVHHKSLYTKLGGFDENMTRLVDWDLILLYTKKHKPYHIDKTVLLYNDIDDHTRISNIKSFHNNYIYIRKKHTPSIPIVTTIITTYNHEKYIEQAIDSALQQQGKFIHEIIISDDGSADSTPQIVANLTNCYPLQIQNLSTSQNVGISKKYETMF
ncbi:MAG: glycosyltransferase family 2 protein [Alphaproteobacteria bacterium]